MSLCIWTTASQSLVLQNLGIIFPKDDAFKFKVVNDMTKPPTGYNVVLALGEEIPALLNTFEILQPNGKKVPKNRTITSLRSTIFNFGPQRYLVSYSPKVHEVDYGKFIDLLCDARVAARMSVTGKYEPEVGRYEYVQDFSLMIEEIEAEFAKTGKPVNVAFDTETVGADPFAKPVGDHPGARFVTWQFSHRPGYSAVRYFSSKEEYESALDNGLYEQLKFLLQSEKISLRLANGKYDLEWVCVHVRGLECTNFKFDTTLVGNLLDENRSNSLTVHSKIYTNLGGYSDKADLTWDKSRMDLRYKEDPEGFLVYAGGDTDACIQSAEAMKTQLMRDGALTKFYVNILHPGARAFEAIELCGTVVDMAAYKELESDLRTELDHLTQEAIKCIGGRLYAKHRDDTRAGGINLTKASLIKDFMFSPTGLNLKPIDLTAKTKEPVTGIDHLMKFKNHPEAGPFVKLLDDYSTASKTLSTYVIGFQEFLRSDGRFHPSYYLHRGNKDLGEGGTVTGRLSCTKPAYQTIPKHTKWGKRIRRIFAAPPGHLVCEQDYSQGELRVVACIANETNMIAAYLAGQDLHVKTGAGIANVTYEQMLKWKKSEIAEEVEKFARYRQYAKPANFGLLYDQSPEGFKTFAEANYGVVLTDGEAVEIHNKFFKTYPGLVEYHTWAKKTAKATGCVRSPLGRIRHLPLIKSPIWKVASKAERQAINSPVQATLTDMMVWALALEWQCGGMKAAPCCGQIHDAAYSYLPEDNWEVHAKRKQEIMENLPFEKVGWKPQLKFIADTKVGYNMADLYEPTEFLKKKAA